MYLLIFHTSQKTCVHTLWHKSVQLCDTWAAPTSHTHCFNDGVQGCFRTKLLAILPICYAFRTSKTQVCQNMQRKCPNGPAVSNVACTCHDNVFLVARPASSQHPVWVCAIHAVCVSRNSIMWSKAGFIYLLPTALI